MKMMQVVVMMMTMEQEPMKRRRTKWLQMKMTRMSWRSYG